MRSSLILAACILFSGCTRVAFTEMVGKPVPASDTKDLLGEWTGEKGVVWRVERDPASDRLIVKWTEEGKEQSRTISVTAIGEHMAIVWAQEQDLGAYLPFRLSFADDAVALLYPDEDVVKKLVDEGRLTGTYSKEKKAWVITKGDLAGSLASKEFWLLDLSMPFTRNKAARIPDPTPAAVAPPVTKEPGRP